MNTYKLTLLAILAALAVVGRILFSFLPNIQPVTSIIIISGIMLGPLSALLLATLVTLISNLVLGMGIWSLWQIISWGLIGILSGFLGKIFKPVPISLIIIFSIFSGYLYGFVVSLTTFQVTGKFWPYYIAGLPFDTNHAIGNALFIVFFYPSISYFLKKYANNHF